MDEKKPADGIVLTPKQARNRRLRNIAIGLSVGLLAAFFYAITIVKLGPGILRPEPWSRGAIAMGVTDRRIQQAARNRLVAACAVIAAVAMVGAAYAAVPLYF